LPGVDAAPAASALRAGVFLGVLAALAGCTYTPETTITVRDPSAVRVEIDEGKGLRTLLPASASPSLHESHEGAHAVEVPIPDAAPPFQSGLRTPTSVARSAGGVIEIHCDECSPAVKTLVPPDGKMTLGASFRVAAFDFTQPEMRVHFVDARPGRYDNLSAFEADVVTPWTNVALVRRVSTPDRALGTKLLLSSAIAAALGGLSLGDGIGDHHPVVTGFAAVILPVALVLAVSGGWYAFAEPEEHVLFRGH
jgi:hypothetical protein